MNNLIKQQFIIKNNNLNKQQVIFKNTLKVNNANNNLLNKHHIYNINLRNKVISDEVKFDEYHKINYPQNNFNKTLILYVFHQYNDRVEKFIKYAIFKDDKYDFFIIINDKNFDIKILNLPYYVKYIIRDNIGFDFGAWSTGLLVNSFYKSYDSFIFINSSVYGPCMEKMMIVNGLIYY